ncbi:ClpP/crotonase-like domain-containing protein [Pisolithus croceorrhizus]|nr:ClpP/crotonase-like domain-containing protein [Pisolithus croceorrhizus]
MSQANWRQSRRSRASPTDPSRSWRKSSASPSPYAMLSRLPALRSRISCSGLIIRRSISSNAAEAFIRPLQSDPEIACLFLNKPQTKNAISRRMLQELQECLYTAKFDKGMSPMDVNKFLADLRTTLGQLEALPMPTIAAIDGPALGGGLELGFACDLRVVGHDVTKIGLPETRLGIIPGAGGTQRAVRLLGLAKAKDLIFTARMLTASEALKWGQLLTSVLFPLQPDTLQG